MVSSGVEAVGDYQLPDGDRVVILSQRWLYVNVLSLDV